MNLSSMTGFARNQSYFQYQNHTYNWVWEIKSVNAKGREIRTRLPQWLDDFEETVKSVCSEVFARGTFNVSLDMNAQQAKPDVEINTDLLKTMSDLVQNIYASDPQNFEKPSVTDLLKVGGIVKIVEKLPEGEELSLLKNELSQSLFQAASDLKKDRQKEGEKIGKVLKALISNMEQIVLQVQQNFKTMEGKIRQKVAAQIADLEKDTQVKPERLEAEILLLIMRADVREEIDRLSAHLKTATELLEDQELVGRRLDFLCQELNREANTLCSKSMDLEQTRLGMALKALIEQFREQIQNME